MSIFEALMLICFGAAWPFSIVKSYHTKQNGSKSLIFLVVLFCGYLMGITHKLLYSRDPVIFLYALNGGMVFVDMMLFLRNRRLEEMCEDGPRKGAGNEIRGKG